LAVILQSGFALLAGITGRKHWNIDEQEAQTIATPAATMIQKLTTAQKKKINQLTAPIVLGSAVASVIIPRLMIDLSMKGAKNSNVRSQPKISTVQQETNRELSTESGNIPERTDSNISKTASTTNDREITDLFRNLDSSAGTGTVKI
jgi:mannitol-specific phosphotransferase system IIBC component